MAGMRPNLHLLLILCLLFSACSEKDEPTVPIVKTLDVTRSKSSSRIFRGNLEHVLEQDTIVAYGFAWESRYGSWEAKKSGKIKKGRFVLNDTTRLSKWTSFSVRAFIETNDGITYGNEVKFATEGE